MERAFCEDIMNADGDVKFSAGVFMEFPKATFQQIANNLGQSLDDITITKQQAGSKAVGKKMKANLSSAKRRPREKDTHPKPRSRELL